MASAHPTLLLGEHRFFSKGAGSDQKAAAELARDNAAAIREAVQPRTKQLVFVVAGLGRGTGAGMAPVVADIARSDGATVVALAIMPFAIDGERAVAQAETDLKTLRANSDATIVLSNELANGRHPERTVRQLQEAINAEAVQAMRAVANAVGDNSRRGVTPAQFAATFASGARAVVGIFEATSRAEVAQGLLGLVDVDGARTGLEGTRRSIVVIAAADGVTVDAMKMVRAEVLCAANDMAHECQIIDRMDASLAPGTMRVTVVSATDGTASPQRANQIRQGGFNYGSSRYRPTSTKATRAERRISEALDPMKVVVRRTGALGDAIH